MTKISALLVFLSLVSGYIFCTRLLAIRYRIRLSRGYHTFLLSAASGVALIGAGFIVLFMLPGSDNAAGFFISLVESRLGITPSKPTLLSLGAGLIAICVAVAAPSVLHCLAQWTRGVDHETLNYWAMRRVEPSPAFVTLIFMSFDHGLPMAVTLSDSKVYIGYPAYIPSSLFSDLDSEIQLVPILSGYRSEHQRSLVITTPYDTVLAELNETGTEDRPLAQFLITVPTREIVHAHLYDLALGEVFRAHEMRLHRRASHTLA